ncbi:uncharacterized protein LOC142233662 [Haematobia irritans]|uniref:uncharacterized protein LOC142233662 n=1 Tax=Haematobia irritans TaxID=7368 RepID=UPI003F50130C
MGNPYKLLLLALVVSVMAHDIHFAFAKDIVTSSNSVRGGGDVTNTQAIRSAASKLETAVDNLDKTVDKSRPSSAVEDWSLVCQQLCGAALGGALCSPYCKNMPVLSQKMLIVNANTLMDPTKLQFICPELCGLQLGDDVCTCKNWLNGEHTTKLATMRKENNICSIFCDIQHVTLTGCSPCAKSDATHQTPTTLANMEKLRGSSITGFDEETTPDWNELCASLCKTGDGGSLCNCDLSPFYV